MQISNQDQQWIDSPMKYHAAPRARKDKSLEALLKQQNLNPSLGIYIKIPFRTLLRAAGDD